MTRAGFAVIIADISAVSGGLAILADGFAFQGRKSRLTLLQSDHDFNGRGQNHGCERDLSKPWDSFGGRRTSLF